MNSPKSSNVFSCSLFFNCFSQSVQFSRIFNTRIFNSQNINKNSPGLFRIHVPRSWKDLYLGRSTKLETARHPGPGHRGSSSLGQGEFRGAPHCAGDLQRIHPGRIAVGCAKLRRMAFDTVN